MIVFGWLVVLDQERLVLNLSMSSPAPSGGEVTERPRLSGLPQRLLARI